MLLDAVVLFLFNDDVALDASYSLQLNSVQPLAKGCQILSSDFDQGGLSMPLYEYMCNTCDHRFEQLQPMNSAGADCPNCEQPAKRAISVFASITKGGTEMPTSMSPLPPLGGGGCCGGGCGCGP